MKTGFPLNLGIEKRLEAALQRLSVSETLPNALPYRDQIPEIAHRLMTMRRINATPAINPEDQLKQAVLRLQKVEDLAHDDRWADSSLPLPLPLRMRLATHAAEAGQLARELGAIWQLPPRRPRARPKHTASANALAAYLYQEFERLMGRTPGRSVVEGGDQRSREGGEFVALVREVFKILGVKASPERAAREAIERAGSR